MASKLKWGKRLVMALNNIVVNVKVVPEKISFDKDTRRIKREGSSILNPLDLIALETAVKLKRLSHASITVISMAPLKEKTLLSSLFKYGVDRVILLSDKCFAGSDTLATSFVLKEAIARFVADFDLIIQGDFSLDGSTGNVGGELASLLNLPFISNVFSIEPREERIIIKRFSEKIETFNIYLPALFSVRGDANKGAVVNLFSILQFEEKEVEIYTNETLNLPIRKVGLEGSLTQVLSVQQDIPEAQPKLIKSNGDKIIFDFLKKAGSI
jgi:electron transfer flavoprotein alpha/beta subunit